MQLIGLVLSDDIILRYVDTLGIYSVFLHRKSVCVIALWAITSATGLSLGLLTALFSCRINFLGRFLEFFGGGKLCLLIKLLKQRRTIVSDGPVFERTSESTALQLLNLPCHADDHSMAGFYRIGQYQRLFHTPKLLKFSDVCKFFSYCFSTFFCCVLLAFHTGGDAPLLGIYPP